MKKFISLFLALLLILTMSSCGNPSNDHYSNGSESNDDVITQSETVTTENVIVTSKVDLNKFVILYEDSAQNDIAKILRDKIQAKTGVLIPINRYKATGIPNDYEFLLDPSHRSLSKEYVDQGFSLACKQYGYIIEDGKICFAGYDSVTLSKSINLFLKDYITSASEILIEDKASKLVDIDFEKENIPQNSDDNTLRVMSNNVIRVKYTAAFPRINNLKVAYAMFDADVIALQECGKAWLYSGGLVNTLKAIGYELVPYDNEECSNPLFYRPETLKLIDSGDVQYENNNVEHDAYRSYAWGYFEQISTGKKFIATSTHLHPSDESIRFGSVKQLSSELKTMETEYGVPVIMLGDYNARTSTGIYGHMKIQFNSARDRASNKKNMSFSTFTGNINIKPAPGTSVLDHCFYSKSGITAKHFETIISEYAYVYTDHLAIICDFVID